MTPPKLSPVRNPTPRNAFRESGDNISKHRMMVDSPEFTRAIHFALLEYQRLKTEDMRDGNSAMAGGFKIQGAIEFAAVLRTLAEDQPTAPRAVDHNLNHS